MGAIFLYFFVHYVTGIIRPAHRAPKIGKCNFIGIGWKKKETALASDLPEDVETWGMDPSKFWTDF